MADVAQEAGVSSMTVSRVLNDRGELRPETRAHVQAVMRRLNYRPSSVARSLTTQRTYTLGLVIPDITNPFFPELVKGVEDTAAQHGYAVILCNSARDAEREVNILHLLEEKRVDGTILCSVSLETPQLIPLLQGQRKVVMFERPIDKTVASSVRVDDAYGGRAAATHLLAAGCRQPAVLAGPSYFHASQERVEGFRAQMLQRGLQLSAEHVVVCEPDEAGGRAGMKVLLSTTPTPDGILCFNDLVAIGAIEACGDAGVRVPDEVAIVGFDDIRLASLISPALTTLSVPKYDLGATLVNMLLEPEGENGASREAIIKPHLIQRQTTKSVAPSLST